MTLPNYKYVNILNLLKDNIPYRTIANIENVSPTTVATSAARYRNSGCILPNHSRENQSMIPLSMKFQKEFVTF